MGHLHLDNTSYLKMAFILHEEKCYFTVFHVINGETLVMTMAANLHMLIAHLQTVAESIMKSSPL